MLPPPSVFCVTPSTQTMKRTPIEFTRSVTPGRARNVLNPCALAGAVLGSSHGYSASTKVWSA
jgi:hypothetical protein